MRHLSIKQKKILRDWYSKNKNNIGFSFDVQRDLPYEIWEQLEKINDFETIYQEINRFIYDLVANTRYGKGGKKSKKCPKCGSANYHSVMGHGLKCNKCGYTRQRTDRLYSTKGGKSRQKKDTRNRCPICQTLIPDGWRTCKSCGDVLKGNPWLCVTDLM